MTRAQRIALAMHRASKWWMGPIEWPIPSTTHLDFTGGPPREATVQFIQCVQVPKPHTWSVFVRGERGLPCS